MLQLFSARKRAAIAMLAVVAVMALVAMPVGATDPTFADEVTTALSSTVASFTSALFAIIPVTFGIAALILVYRRVKGLISR